MLDFDQEEAPISQRQQQAAAGFSSEKFLLIFKRYWYWVPLSFLLSAFGAYSYLKYSKPTYQASSLIRLEVQKEASNLGITQIQAMPVDNLEGELELIRSQRVAQHVINTIDLQISYFREGNILTTELYQSCPFKIQILSDPKYTPYDVMHKLKFISAYEYKLDNGKVYKVGDKVQINNFVFSVQWTDVVEQDIDGIEYLFVVNSNGALLSYLHDNLVVEANSTEARTLSIAFKDFNRIKATDIVNAYDSV